LVVFINFRNGDGEDFAEILDAYAKTQLGDDEVVRSRRCLDPGVEYCPELLDAVARSHVLLVVIGPNWLMSRHGERLIDEPDDAVRREIATALEHGKRVVPVLIGPSPRRLSVADELPPDIAGIVHAHSIVIGEENREPGIRALLAELIDLEPGVDQLLAGVADDPARWVVVIERLSRVPADQGRRIVEQLRSVDIDALPENSLLSIWQAVRSLVASHRFLTTGLLPEDVAESLASWADDHALDRLPQHHAWLFAWHPRVPEEADRLRREAVRAVLDARGMAGLLQLAEASELPDLVGVITVDLTGDALLDEVVELLGPSGSAAQLANGWVRRAVATVEDDWVARLTAIMPLLAESQQAALLLATTWSAVIRPLADKADAAVARRFWAQVPPWPMFGEPDWFISQLLNHERPWAAIDTMSLAVLRDDNDDDPWRPSADQVLAALLLAMRPDTSDRPYGGTSGYAVGQLLGFLASTGVDELTLVRLELVFRSVLSPTRGMTILDRALVDDPEIYVEVVDLAYGEPHDPGLIWVQAQLALSDWRAMPGRTADGGIDGDRLRDWVRTVRELLAESGPLAAHSESVIGGMLSASPEGKDGAWPAEPVRELLEDPRTENLAAGFIDATTMNQGPTIGRVVDGGQQGRRLAEKYDGFAETLAPEWPRCADILRSCAQQFRRLARVWDDDDPQ
jgi:hypothetical protein